MDMEFFTFFMYKLPKMTLSCLMESMSTIQ